MAAITRRAFLLGAIAAGWVAHHRPGHNHGKPTPTPTPTPTPEPVGDYTDAYHDLY